MQILNIDGHYFVEPFRKLGHDVFWLGPQAASDIPLSQAISLKELLRILDDRGFRPDLVVWGDLCKPPSVIGLETLPAVTVGYSIDQYCNPWHVPYSAAFDLMLVAQKDYVPVFEEARLGNTLEWMPLFCNTLRDKDMKEERDIPVGFVGTVNGAINTQRRQFLDTFKQHHPLLVMQGNYVPIFNRSKIVLNQSAAGELNFRIFEAMACGAAVLTEAIENGLSELFTNGEDILTYPRGDAIAASTVARTALNSPQLAEITRNGKRNVLANHTSMGRARHILKRAHEIASNGPSWRRLHTKIVKRNIGTSYSILAVDEQLPLTPELRNLYATIGNTMLQETAKG